MSSDGPGPPPAAPGGGRPRPHTVQLGEELLALRRETGEHARQLRETAGHVAEIADHLSRLSPRVDDLERSVAGLAGAIEAAAPGGEGADDEALSLTPAVRWSQLGPGDRHAAWDALAGFVSQVLNAEYRLTRAELPDCWPAHPRAVRELAWLRALHVDSSAPGVRPDLVAEWHVRWLPAALTNLASAIDPRECAPGKHRLTEEERHQYHQRCDEARQAGQAVPELSAERSPDRPRYLPERFPPRRSYDDDPTYDPDRSGPRLLDKDTPAPPSTPDCWWQYFLDARMADIGGTEDDAPGTGHAVR
ncbi:hypothetical protein H7X46_00205 [Pseudonocardia sp. C8]|uniref:hypothetical protein n=1 Tax=Pseudonocardia sp. C8 TaxID=2762759 RepID=UPI0016424359|nr:hypothetical protein [Pseudonocardia sp. C8]MBC3189491.1 hypothetical protein [Pseudonocardia sp. C8]